MSNSGFDAQQVLEDNPLVDFVELPSNCSSLKYCNVLCGVIRGALEMVRICSPTLCRFGLHFTHLNLQVNIRVECTVAKDTLKGDDATELHLKLLSQEAESYPFKDDD